MFPETKSRETSGSRENKTNLFPEGTYIKCFVIYLDFHLNNHKTNTQTKMACGQQLRIPYI